MWPWRKRKTESVPLFEETAGASYAQLIEGKLQDEAQRRESTERRGLSIVTSTGIIAGLALALGPLLSQAKIHFPTEATAFISFGALFLGTALVCGLVANMPRTFNVVAGSALDRVVRPEFWSARREIGSRRAAEVRLEELKSARKANTAKSWWLRAGLSAQVLGIVCVGAAVLLLLVANAPPG